MGLLPLGEEGLGDLDGVGLLLGVLPAGPGELAGLLPTMPAPAGEGLLTVMPPAGDAPGAGLLLGEVEGDLGDEGLLLGLLPTAPLPPGEGLLPVMLPGGDAPGAGLLLGEVEGDLGDEGLLLGPLPAAGVGLGDLAGLGELTSTGLLLGLTPAPARLQVAGWTNKPLYTAWLTIPFTWRLRVPSVTSTTKDTVVAVFGAVVLAMEKLLSSVVPSATTSSLRGQSSLLAQSMSTIMKATR